MCIRDRYTDKYTMKTDRIDAVREQAKYEVGFEKFLKENGIGAFADTFQDLHGLKPVSYTHLQQGYGHNPKGKNKTGRKKHEQAF